MHNESTAHHVISSCRRATTTATTRQLHDNLGPFGCASGKRIRLQGCQVVMDASVRRPEIEPPVFRFHAGIEFGEDTQYSQDVRLSLRGKPRPTCVNHSCYALFCSNRHCVCVQSIEDSSQSSSQPSQGSVRTGSTRPSWETRLKYQRQQVRREGSPAFVSMQQGFDVAK